MDRKNIFTEGFRDGIPIGIGYFAVSFAFGIQAADINLSPFQAGLISLMNVTSAGQFAGLAVIAQAGTYIEMAVLQFIVNLRYLLMSAALSQKLSPDTKTIHRLGIAYGVTDEIFGISIARKGLLDPRYSYGAILAAALRYVPGYHHSTGKGGETGIHRGGFQNGTCDSLLVHAGASLSFPGHEDHSGDGDRRRDLRSPVAGR